MTFAPDDACSGSACADAAGSGGTGEGSVTESCRYVDVLFVVDDSTTMHPHQERLAAAFPVFEAMVAALPPGPDLGESLAHAVRRRCDGLGPAR